MFEAENHKISQFRNKPSWLILWMSGELHWGDDNDEDLFPAKIYGASFEQVIDDDYPGFLLFKKKRRTGKWMDGFRA